MKTFEQFKDEMLSRKYEIKLYFSLKAKERDTSVEINQAKEFRGKEAVDLLKALFTPDIEPRIKTLYASYLADKMCIELDERLKRSNISLMLPGDIPAACQSCGEELPYKSNYCPNCGKAVEPYEDRVDLISTALVQQHYDKLPAGVKRRIKAIASEACPEWGRAYVKFLWGRKPLYELILEEMGI